MGTLPFDSPVLTWSSTLVTGHNTAHGRQGSYFPVQKGGLFGAKCIESCQTVFNEDKVNNVYFHNDALLLKICLPGENFKSRFI